MIYLAGAIKHAVNAGRQWRTRIQSAFLDTEFWNPLDEVDAVVDTAHPEEIVAADKRGIRESDGVLVGYTDTKQIGTPMEVMYAYERDKPVAIWLRDDTDEEDLSAWYRHHCFVSENRADCVEHLKGEL
jgi:nucleoside 2-deoxyribosyltransferase